jgi:hypothetical protein
MLIVAPSLPGVRDVAGIEQLAELVGQKVFRLRLRTQAHFHELWGCASKHAGRDSGSIPHQAVGGKKIQTGLDTAYIHVHPHANRSRIRATAVTFER